MRPLAAFLVSLFFVAPAFPEADTSEGVTVSVVDDAGAPLPAGTTVSLVLNGPISSGDWVTEKVRDDRTLRLKGLHAGKYSIGLRTVEHDVERLDLEVPCQAPQRVVFKKRGWLEGRLLAESGDPLADTPFHCTLDRKEAAHPDLIFLDYPEDGERASRTDAGGRFRLAGPISGSYALSFEGASFAALVPHVVVAAAASADVGDVRTEKTGAVEIVFRKGNDPLANSEVSVLGELEVAGSQGNPANLRRDWMVKTDANGRLLLEGLHAGRWDLTASLLDIDCLNQPLPPVTVRVGETSHAGLTLGGGSVAGVVADEEGKPLEDAQVGIPSDPADPLTGRQPNWGRSTRSGPGGAWLLDGLDEGTCAVGAWMQGATATIERGVVVPRNGKAPEVRLVLKRGSSTRITVRVLNSDGSPMAGAVVTVSIQTPHRSSGYSPIAADADGLATQDELEPGECEVTVRVPKRAPCAHHVLLAGGANGPVDFVMEAGATMTGRVVDATGAPVAGALVRAVAGERMRHDQEWEERMAGPGSEDFEDERFGPGRGEEPGEMAARTGTDGSFRVEGVPEGKYGVVAKKKRCRVARSAVMDVGKNATVACGDLALVEKPRTSGPLALRLLDASTGRPAPAGSYTVWLEGPSVNAQSYVKTGEDGAGTVEGEFPFGAATLSVAGSGLACDPVHVTVAAEENAAPVEVKLGKAPSIEGRVLDPTGNPAVGATVDVDGTGCGQTDTGGRFAIQGVRPGDHVVHAELAGVAPASAEVRALVLGEARGDVTLRLLRAASVVGRVVDSAGAKVAGARVQMMCVSADGTQSFPWWDAPALMRGLDVDAEGRFRVGGLPPGRYRFDVWGRPHGHASTDVSVVEGQSVELPDLRLEE